MGRVCAHPEHTHELPDDAPANKLYLDDNTCGRDARRLAHDARPASRRSRRFWARYRRVHRRVATTRENAAKSGTAAVAAILAATLTLGFATSAGAFTNGHAKRSQLAPIAGGLNHAGKTQPAYLLRGSIAASWNTMNLCAAAAGVPLTPGPSTYSPAATAYRSYAIQVILRRQLGANAAIPGHSNHGAARAVDLRTLKMRTWIDHHGARFGWAKKWSDASWEWWHLWGHPEYVKFRRPDPGSSLRYPNLRRGSGGPCQTPAVKELQRRLGIKQTGTFGKGTLHAVRVYQHRHHLHVDGLVGSMTWLKLRRQARGISKKRDARVVASGLPGQVKPMAGQDVRAMQGLLNARFRELHRPRYRVKVDGVTGPAFTRAVKRFQILANRHGKPKVKVTGRVNDATYARLLHPFAPATQVLAVTGEGAALVAGFEGERLCPYRDAVGIPTQGYGHTHGVRIGGKCWTHAKALKVLRSDLDLFSKGITRIVHVRIGSRQFNALVSWSFNVGLGGAGSSTLIHELNRKHYGNAGNQFKAWNRAGGRPLLGLTRRRRAECRMYEKGSSARARRAIHC